MRTKLLGVVIIIAALLRCIGLGTNPPSLNWDEIAIGWNAYSILHTGRDEYGQFLPTTFRSFDDYKSPAYVYAVIPSLVLFGKTEFAIRFPSALAGILTVLVSYFLVRQLLYVAGSSEVWKNRAANIGLFTAGILAITPWHVHFSRVAFEANFALFWETFSAYLFLKWLHTEAYTKKRKALLLAAVLASMIAIYAYANARLFLPLLLVGWSVLSWKIIVQRKKEVGIALLVACLCAIPLITQMIQGVGLARFQATSVFSRPEIYERNDEKAVEDFRRGEGLLSIIVHNKRYAMAEQVVENYLDHFSYNFLFVKGDLPRHQVPGFGLLYIWQLPLIIIGATFLLKNRRELNVTRAIWWLFIALIPASLTWQVPHSIRSQLMLPVLTLFSAAGLWQVCKYLQQKDLEFYTKPQATSQIGKLRDKIGWLAPKALFIAIILSMGTSAYIFAYNYHNYLPKEFAREWLYGRKEMVSIVEAEKNSKDIIIVDLSVDWAYLWFLWYGNYAPEWYLNQGGTVSGGFEESQNKVGKIEFHKFDFDPKFFSSQQGKSNALYIGLPEQFPDNLVPYKTIRDPSGKAVLYIVKT